MRLTTGPQLACRVSRSRNPSPGVVPQDDVGHAVSVHPDCHDHRAHSRSRAERRFIRVSSIVRA